MTKPCYHLFTTRGTCYLCGEKSLINPNVKKYASTNERNQQPTYRISNNGVGEDK
jgi:hypothetical protein